MGFPGGPDSKGSTCNVGDLGSIPGLGRSPGEGNGNPLQYSCLEIPMDRGAWWAAVTVGSQRVRHDRATNHSTAHLAHTSRLIPSGAENQTLIQGLTFPRCQLTQWVCYSAVESTEANLVSGFIGDWEHFLFLIFFLTKGDVIILNHGKVMSVKELN